MAQFTRRAIMESFLRLVGSKPLDKITVKDIVEDCEITRNTFYYHFQDIYDLTAEVFRSEFARVIKKRGEQGDWRDQLRAVVDFAQQNRGAVLHIYNSARRQELMRSFEKSTLEYMLQVVHSYPQSAGLDEADIRLVADVVRCALTGLAEDWLNKGMKEAPRPTLDRMDRLFEGCIENCLGNARSASPQKHDL